MPAKHCFCWRFYVNTATNADRQADKPTSPGRPAQVNTTVVRHALDGGAKEVEVTKEAQDAWVALLLTGMGRMIGSPDRTPGYYNNEGQDPGPAARLNVGYPASAAAYFRYRDDWRADGRFEGLSFRRAPGADAPAVRVPVRPWRLYADAGQGVDVARHA